MIKIGCCGFPVGMKKVTVEKPQGKLTCLNRKINGVFRINLHGSEFIATRNLSPGIAVYGERLINIAGVEYRAWSPVRSKLAAMLKKGFIVPVREDWKILYLGAASGTTVSHVSDIASSGRVYAVEFAPAPMRKLVAVCEARPNMIPVFADAASPASYANIVESVDMVYQDIAQRNQASIAIRNADLFLKKEGYLIAVFKARSIDAVSKPKDVFKKEMDILKEKFRIIDSCDLSPFHKDHLAVLALRH